MTAGVGYAVSESSRLNNSTVTVPVSHSYWILIPSVTQDNRRHDAVFTRTGIRYAVRDGMNISFGFRADASRSLSNGSSGVRKEYEYGWRNITTGFDFRLSSPFSQPFTLIFAEVAAVEKGGAGTLYARAATVGISSHWAFDPVIASLTATYTYLGARRRDGISYDPGDVLGFGGSFGVVMNPEITLRAGFLHGFRIGQNIHDVKDDWRSAAAFNLGYIQRLSSKLVMNIEAQAGVAGSGATQISASFTWRP